MNKQEAIERIKNIGTLNIYDKEAGQQVDMVIKNEVLDIISQIHEPQKVVVPKFVAEWIKSQKESFSDVSAIEVKLGSSTYSNLVKNQTVTTDTLLKISNFLCCDVSELIESGK
jgi:DNA-binding Xre family transcriptional regulator